MKKILGIIVVLFITTPLFASTYCKQDDVDPNIGVNCKTVGVSGKFKLPSGVYIAEKDFNEYGYYERIVIDPGPGTDQVRDGESWNFVIDHFDFEYLYRNLTPQEIQDRDDEITAEEGMISRELYYFTNCLMTDGAIDLVNGRINPAVCVQRLKDAYQARGRLEAQ